MVEGQARFGGLVKMINSPKAGEILNYMWSYLTAALANYNRAIFSEIPRGFVSRSHRSLHIQLSQDMSYKEKQRTGVKGGK